MIPYPYNMVDMGGIDLAEANGTVVEGLYAKIVEAVNACGDVVLYNWKFAGIEIAPQHTSILLGDPIIINGAVQVTEQDEVTVPGINPDPPVLTNLSVVENGEYFPSDYDADGFSSVEANVPPPILQPLYVASNGVYYPPEGVYGFSFATVNVAAQLNWRDSFAVNWDFSSPVNTRGSTSYSASSRIYTIDGWQLQEGILEFVEGGIRLSRRTAETAGFFMQRFKSDMTTAIVGRTMTLSAMVDGELAFATADPVPSASGDSGFGFQCSGVTFRGYGYGTEIALTVDIGSDTSNHIIQAIKFEAGNTQTLATQVNGVWVLNNTMDAVTEYIKARDGTVYN